MKAETIFGLIINTCCLDELEPKRFRMKGSLIAQALFRLSINQSERGLNLFDFTQRRALAAALTTHGMPCSSQHGKAWLQLPKGVRPALHHLYTQVSADYVSLQTASHQ
jgi:hypothetical protein